MKTINQTDYIEQDSDKLSGKPVFKGTRVPVSYLLEFIEAGDSLDEFFEQYPMSEKGKKNVRGFLKQLRERYSNV